MRDIGKFSNLNAIPYIPVNVKEKFEAMKIKGSSVADAFAKLPGNEYFGNL